jgi:hypothetical protein
LTEAIKSPFIRDVPRLESAWIVTDKPMILLLFSVNFITSSSLLFCRVELTVVGTSRFYEL